MFEQVTPEYIRFIKQYLIQRLYSKYIAYNYKTNTPDTLFTDLTNEQIWNEIFNSDFIILNYYTCLLPYSESNMTKELIVYKQETFQEYIDRTININTIGTYDYQQFIKNMNSTPFYNNMVTKYNNTQSIKTVKNQLIYIVKLYLTKSSNPSNYMTEEEAQEVDTFLNMIPYFEYMRSNNWVDHTQCFHDELQDKVETDAMKYIYESIYTLEE